MLQSNGLARQSNDVLPDRYYSSALLLAGTKYLLADSLFCVPGAIDHREHARLYWYFALGTPSLPARLESFHASLHWAVVWNFRILRNFDREPAARLWPCEIMSSVKATQLRPGMVIQHEGQLYTVFSTDHRTPGNKRGSMQTRLKNLRNGVMIDYRFRAEEFVDRAILDEIEFEYLYSEGDDFHFMNTKSYEQMQMTKDELGETVYYLIPNTIVKIEFFDEKAIGVDLPDTMDMKVVQTEPTLQKATASAVMKPATLETGLVVNVPPFVNEGDRIRVDTSEARYVQRVE
jgi:elongation factor P